MTSEEQEMKEGTVDHRNCKNKGDVKVKNKIGEINMRWEKKVRNIFNFFAGIFKLVGSNPAHCSSPCLAQTLETQFYGSLPISFWHLACSCIGLGLQRSEENGFLIKLLHTRVQKLSHNVIHNEN